MENVIKIWALGGVAAKIVSRLRKTVVSGDGVVPKFEYVYIDTSSSETAFIPSTSELHVVKNASGLSGSGGNRGLNYQNAAEQVPGIVAKNVNPGAINILIGSTGGGSGSTLMYVVEKELLKEGEAVISFTSNTTDSASRTHNAITATASFDSLAKANNCVIPMFAYDTADFTNFTDNDEKMVTDIILTSSILSNTVVGVDDMDRRTMLNPCLTGKEDLIQAGVKALKLHEGMDYEGSNPVASVLTLVDTGFSDNVGTDAPFLFSGALSVEFKTNFLTETTPNAVSLLVVENSINNWIEKLNVKLEKQLKSRGSSLTKGAIEVTEKTKATVMDDGFVC